MAPKDIQSNLKENKKTKHIENCVQDSKNQELKKLFDRLWESADELRANSKLRSSQYSTPVLGILFLRYAYYIFEETKARLEKKYVGRNRPIRKLDYHAEGALYLTEKSIYKNLLELPEGDSIGNALDKAMRSIEEENKELLDVLPKVYSNMEDSVLINLLKLFHKIPTELDRDIFGNIYEYFLGEFAKSEGQRGGEFYTPTSIVKLIVEILEPYHGKILDPACGSGGMFVQSAQFIKDHLQNPYKEISIYGQEKADDTVRLCKMNLGIHGLSGDIKQGNTYYEDSFNMNQEFDFVMANPPFNVDKVDKEAIKDDPRYLFGIPSADNANYLWIQIFYSMLTDNGKAGFVMANSANDAGHSELEIRKKIIKKGVVDVVISISSNFFYSVTLPVTLWFLNKEKFKTSTENKILFIDAKKIYNQVDRSHREFTPQQLEFISNIVRLYRGQKVESKNCSTSLIEKLFPKQKYQDVKGFCKVVTLQDIKEQGWSLNPGRYVGFKTKNQDTSEFYENLLDYKKELESLTSKGLKLEKEIEENIEMLLKRD